MEFEPTPIEGAYIVNLSKIEDERGFFARAFCRDEFTSVGINANVVQANLSHNKHRGTLRGMHYQVEPALETKFVRCVSGAIQDVIIDMRPESKSFQQHFSIELSSENARALFVPAMCAHGFQTLRENSDVFYLVSGSYSPTHERGLRHDDPAFAIDWPLRVDHISEKDSQWPLLNI